ncbi:MAG TPA: TraR/DksA family transcriptional regulator [Ramlibacter sp.]|uniref:TraR/DksA family transcriptional regulator n=1 Tax=Ramlibacter sp. TaxID=1917967 RepID=UPI002ED2F5DA
MRAVIDTTAPSPQLTLIAQKLRLREGELRTAMHATAPLGDHLPEVQDFKDVAAEESRALLDEAAYAHAAEELSQVLAAQRRVDEGTYGLCEDCGEAIDERRLVVLPATRFCTACQAIHERPGTGR